MKILQLGKFYPLKGGVEKVIYALAEGLSEQGVRCDILFAGCDGHSTDFDINANSHVFLSKTLMEAKATQIAPSMISTLRKICKGYDIIHVHHPDPMAAVALYSSGYKGKVVLHWHCDIVRQNKLLVFFRPLQDWLIRRADIIIGTTPVYIQHSSALRDVQKKCCSIPIGVYETYKDLTLTQEIQRRYNGRRIVFTLGRLVLYKGYEYLIEAAKYLSDDYVVLIGGTGHQHNHLEELIAKNGLKDKVFMLGHIPEKQLGTYFDACKVFCLTSIDKREAFAIVQAKAMSHARPVVSTDIPESGVPWVNQHGFSGLNVPPRNAKAVAEAIQEVCEDEVRYSQYCQQAYERYKEFFRMEDMISAHKALYEKLMKLKG